MPDYPTDLDLNEHKDIHLDGGNDLALVSDEEQIAQSVAIDVFDELKDFVGGRITGKTLGLLEERIRQGLNDDPQLDEVRNVTVEEYDRTTSTVTVAISVSEDDDFTIEMNA